MGTSADLVIRNGLVVDGVGGAPYAADVAITGDRISAIGEGLEGAAEIDATGCIVTPGFIDVHTHYDGQLIWSDRLTPSSVHGVTSVVVGNCGVGFAPCRPSDRDMLVSVMEGVEDIPEIVMTAGLDWQWETFGDFLDAIQGRAHDIDYAVYLPHSALRVYVMGKRGADRERATPADLAEMTRLMIEALEAGAVGFSTSATAGHRTGKGEQIPSYMADEEEYMAIAEAMRLTGKGIFQIVPEYRSRSAADLVGMFERIVRASGRPLTFTLVQFHSNKDVWRDVLDEVDRANRTPDVSITPQVYPRPIGMMLGVSTSQNPFSLCPSYEPLLSLPLDARVAALREPALRARLLVEQPGDPTNPLFRLSRDFAHLYPFRTPDYEPATTSSIAAQAAAAGVTPEELAYDLMLENDGRALLLAPISNYADETLDPVARMIHHPETVIGLGDGGAHYGFVCDSSYTTYLLTYWTRERASGRLSLADAVAALTSRPARLVGFNDRGRIAEGYKADVNVIEIDRLALELPEVVHDLPGGGKRLHQRGRGYRATIVSGQPILRDDGPTAARPGRLLRGEQPAPAPRERAAA